MPPSVNEHPPQHIYTAHELKHQLPLHRLQHGPFSCIDPRVPVVRAAPLPPSTARLNTTTVRGRGERGAELLQTTSAPALQQGEERCEHSAECTQCARREIARRGSFRFSPALAAGRGCSPCYLLPSRHCSCWASSSPPPPPFRQHTRCRSDAQRHSSAARAPQHAARSITSPNRGETCSRQHQPEREGESPQPRLALRADAGLLV